MVKATSAAVTAAPVLKRRPFRSVNTYVLPSREILGKLDASSGVTRKPPGSGLSARCVKLAQAALTHGTSPAVPYSAPSIESMFPAASATRNVPPASVAAEDSGVTAKAEASTSSATTLPDILRAMVSLRHAELKAWAEPRITTPQDRLGGKACRAEGLECLT